MREEIPRFSRFQRVRHGGVGEGGVLFALNGKQAADERIFAGERHFLRERAKQRLHGRKARDHNDPLDLGVERRDVPDRVAAPGVPHRDHAGSLGERAGLLEPAHSRVQIPQGAGQPADSGAVRRKAPGVVIRQHPPARAAQALDLLHIGEVPAADTVAEDRKRVTRVRIGVKIPAQRVCAGGERDWLGGQPREIRGGKIFEIPRIVVPVADEARIERRNQSHHDPPVR